MPNEWTENVEKIKESIFHNVEWGGNSACMRVVDLLDELDKLYKDELATALEEQIQNIIDANGFVAIGKDGKEVEYELKKVRVKAILEKGKHAK